jgi:hypothetical protein
MTDDLKPGPPVSGYRSQSDANIALVNEFKVDEERLLRKIDALMNEVPESTSAMVTDQFGWLLEARSHIQIGFMALNRAVFQPGRVKLPEDE